MKFRIEAANSTKIYGDGARFIGEYGDKLTPYKLKLIKSNEKYGDCKAYITVSSLQELVELEKSLDTPLIIQSGDDEMCILIYDDYIE